MGPAATPDPSSIHYRRRWYYVLWVGLLAISVGALALWERPKNPYEAPLTLKFRATRPVPQGTRFQVWVGPSARRPGAAWQEGAGAFAEQALETNRQVVFRTLKVKVAPRRWVKGACIPRSTWDLMVIRITQPAQEPRYFALSFEEDLAHGRVGAKHGLFFDIAWPVASFSLDARVPPGNH